MPRAKTLLPLCCTALVLALSCGAAPVPPLQLIGSWHTLRDGDTVESIAAHYRIPANTIADVNDLPSAGPIAGRSEIFIPLNAGMPPGDGTPPTPIATAAPPPPASPETPAVAAVTGRCKPAEQACYVWPAAGEVVQTFSREAPHHDGLDIAGEEGTPIVAVADGQVLYSGDAILGYGNLLLLRHDDDIITVYAHNKRNLVAEGQTVTQGQRIAEMGRSGSASRVHLHFEVRRGEVPVDPLLYLSDNGAQP
jgi:murein DD-endopeptidase MepM/ murein hydrolase activator NlpD